MSLIKVIIIISVLCLTKSVFPNDNDSIAENIFRLIYNEQYDKAEIALAQQEASLDAFYADILKTDLYWWKFVQDSGSNEGKQLKGMIRKLSNSDKNSADGKILQIIGKSYQIRYEFKRYNIVGAAILRSDIKILLEEIKAEKLGFKENRLELLYLYETLFRYFNSLINPFFEDSKRTERRNALKKLEEFIKGDDLVVTTMACYFSGKIFLNIEKEPENGMKCFEQLCNLYPDNTIFFKLMDDCTKKINPKVQNVND